MAGDRWQELLGRQLGGFDAEPVLKVSTDAIGKADEERFNVRLRPCAQLI